MKVDARPNGYISAAVIAMIWLVIFLSIYVSLLFQKWPIYLLAVFMIGTCQRYLEELSHQAMHNNLFSHAKLNHRLDIFYAIPLFYTIKSERDEHYQHHTHLAEQQATENFAYDHLGIKGSWLQYLWYRRFILFAQPYLGMQALIEIKNIASNFTKNFLSCYLYHTCLIAILIITHHISLYFYYWLVPYFSVFCIFYYYSELFTHFGCRDTHLSRDTHHWFFNWFVAPLGFCKYHSLHHVAPKIPWFRYSKVNDSYESNQQSLRQTILNILRLDSA